MPTYIIKLSTSIGPQYLEWSTIVDAPITAGMSLDEFKQYYLEEYGRQSFPGLEERLARVEMKGTSDRLSDDLEDLIVPNRAGKNETSISIEQIIDFYCIRSCRGDQPEGKQVLGVVEE